MSAEKLSMLRIAGSARFYPPKDPAIAGGRRRPIIANTATNQLKSLF
jgi:hypothetical protein